MEWLEYSTKGKAKKTLARNFKENEHYIFALPSGQAKNGSGGHNKETILLSPDCLKDFSMLAQTKKGDEARQYFRNCETQLKAIIQNKPQLPQTYADALRLYANEVEAKEQAEQRLLTAKEETNTALSLLDKAEYGNEMFNALTNTNGMYAITKVGEALSAFSSVFSYKKIQGWLVKQGILNKTGSDKYPKYSVIAKYREHFKEVLVPANTQRWEVTKIFVYPSGFKLIKDFALKDGSINMDEYRQLSLDLLKGDN